jgi:nucleotide-binding universal stress UspA family protein
MPLPKTILVPTDFGEPSEAALDYAIDFARLAGAQIVLLHAYEMPIIGMPDGALVATPEIASRMAEGAQVGLDRQLSSRAASGVTIRGMVKQGSPYVIINEAVAEVGADLIVLGTHGRTGLPRLLLGSVAEKIVRTATVPVLTIHPNDVVHAAAVARGAEAFEHSNGVEVPVSSHR